MCHTWVGMTEGCRQEGKPSAAVLQSGAPTSIDIFNLERYTPGGNV